ncbi:MAG: hypothetical protein ACK5QT_05320 [Oligoflexia bacterium]
MKGKIFMSVDSVRFKSVLSRLFFLLGAWVVSGALEVSARAEGVDVLTGMVVPLRACQTRVSDKVYVAITSCQFFNPTVGNVVVLEIAPARKYTQLKDESLRGVYADREIVEFIVNAGLNKVNLDLLIGKRGIVGVSVSKGHVLHSNGKSAFVNTDVLSLEEQAEFEGAQSK